MSTARCNTMNDKTLALVWAETLMRSARIFSLESLRERDFLSFCLYLSCALVEFEPVFLRVVKSFLSIFSRVSFGPKLMRSLKLSCFSQALLSNLNLLEFFLRIVEFSLVWPTLDDGR